MTRKPRNRVEEYYSDYDLPCYDRSYLIKVIFGKMAEKSEFIDIIQIISYAVINSDPETYKEAGNWFADRGEMYIDISNHFYSIAGRIERQREKLYTKRYI